jgi:hypothetical protein
MKWAAHRSLRRDSAATGKRSIKASSITLSNEGALDGASLCFGTQLPVSACILPPFFELPSVHMCVSSYAGSVTLAAVTPQNGVAVVNGYLDALLEQLRIAIPGLAPHRFATYNLPLHYGPESLLVHIDRRANKHRHLL